MNRGLTRWELLGICFVSLVGFALHYSFAWSGNWKPIALMAPVNESVWEHFKLVFWPALLWALLEYAALELDARIFWSAKGYALLVSPILIVIVFYSYTAVLGRNNLTVDIATFLIAVVATQLASAKLVKANLRKRWVSLIGLGLLLCQFAAYSTFTFYPPPLGLFEDGRNGIRGIPRCYYAQPITLIGAKTSIGSSTEDAQEQAIDVAALVQGRGAIIDQSQGAPGQTSLYFPISAISKARGYDTAVSINL